MSNTSQQDETLYEGPVAGYRHYHGDLWEAWLHEGSRLELIREVENPYDVNAISIFWETERLGYVPKTHSAELAHAWTLGKKMYAEVVKLDFDAEPGDRLIIKIKAENATI